jgi:hypothetical protein
MNVPQTSPSGTWQYSPYISVPISSQIFYIDNYPYPVDDSVQVRGGAYIYTGSVAYLLMPSAEEGVLGGPLNAGTYYQKNIHATINAIGVDYDVYSVSEYDIRNKVERALHIGNATVISASMKSGDTLDCQAVIDDPHNMLSSVSAYITGEDGTTYTFDEGERQGQYSLTWQQNNPSNATNPRWNTVARLLIPNFGGCTGNLSAVGMCNYSVSNYTFGRSGKTTRFACVITAFDINGNSVTSPYGWGQFTNTLKTPYSVLTMNIDVGGFLGGIIKWMFASVENLLVSLFVFLAFVAGMPVLYLVLEKGWTLMGGKGEGGGAVQVAPSGGV